MLSRTYWVTLVICLSVKNITGTHTCFNFLSSTTVSSITTFVTTGTEKYLLHDVNTCDEKWGENCVSETRNVTSWVTENLNLEDSDFAVMRSVSVSTPAELVA